MGTYFCTQGVTNVVVEITRASAAASGETFSGTLGFETTQGKSGKFKVRGTYSLAGRYIQVIPERGGWVQRPKKYVMVTLNGRVNRKGTRIHGAVNTFGCGHFSVDLVSPTNASQVPEELGEGASASTANSTAAATATTATIASTNETSFAAPALRNDASREDILLALAQALLDVPEPYHEQLVKASESIFHENATDDAIVKAREVLNSTYQNMERPAGFVSKETASLLFDLRAWRVLWQKMIEGLVKRKVAEGQTLSLIDALYGDTG